MTFEDNTIHEYLYQNKKIYYAVVSSTGIVEKKIELCSQINNAEFECENNLIKITVILGEMTYKNNFNI